MSGGNLRGSISYPEEIYAGYITFLYHGCYRSNHGISIGYTIARSEL